MPTVGEEIGKLKQEVNLLKDDTTGTGDNVGLADQVTGDAIIETRTVIMHKKQPIPEQSFIVGLTSIVGSAGGDVGTEYSVNEWSEVKNKNNTFEDIFDTDLFIDTVNSDGTYTEPTGLNYGYYTIQTGEILQSNIVARRPSTTYTEATLSAVVGSGTPSLSLSGDGGDTWESVANNTLHTFLNADEEGILFKIENQGGTTFPMTFPFTFLGGGDIDIIGISLTYL